MQHHNLPFANAARSISGDIPFKPLRIAVMTVSDTRTFDQDESGECLVARLTSGGHQLAERCLLPDERKQIKNTLLVWVRSDTVDVILTTGGTGLTARDVTVEAHHDVYEKQIDAFSVLFALVSLQTIGLSALQSRACAGIAHGTYLFALPGSPSACKDAWDHILKWQLDSRYTPCNLVDIKPRLRKTD